METKQEIIKRITERIRECGGEVTFTDAVHVEEGDTGVISISADGSATLEDFGERSLDEYTRNKLYYLYDCVDDAVDTELKFYERCRNGF